MRYVLALIKAGVAVLITWIVLFLPMEGMNLQLVSTIKVVTAFACLVYIGKLLYDTLFYNRYIP
ncbi:MAG: hypothetical protein HYX92_13135 [Chloroflexi bacterium]|nr:hypothetical protein [Chloroflexota bacterium]